VENNNFGFIASFSHPIVQRTTNPKTKTFISTTK